MFPPLGESRYERYGRMVSVRNTMLQFDNLITKCAMQDVGLRDAIYAVLREFAPKGQEFRVYLKGGSAIAEMTNETEFYRGDIDIGIKHADVEGFKRMMLRHGLGRRTRMGDDGNRVLEESVCGLDIERMRNRFGVCVKGLERRIAESMVEQWGRVREFLISGTVNEPFDSVPASSVPEAKNCYQCYLFDTYRSVLTKVYLSSRRSNLRPEDFKGESRLFFLFYEYFFLVARAGVFSL